MIRPILPLLLILLFSCNTPEKKEDSAATEPTSKTSLFRSISSSESNLRFTNEIRENKDINVLTYEYLYNGGGVAAGDINNDGLIDLYFTANMQPNALFLNKGSLKFEDISRSSKTAGKQGWTTGCTMVDINNDGWLDIYVCRSGNLDQEARRNLLFINNKDLTFTEQGAEYGLDDPGYSTHASFFDFDKDGDLDMFLLNHNILSPKGFYVSEKKGERDPNPGDQLFRNDDGHFINISKAAGIISNPIGFGLGVSTADLNNDSWPDIFVTNDYYEQDYYYINQQDGSFKEELKNAFTHISHFSMGTDVADFNNDLLPDIMSLDMMPRDNKRQKLLQGPSNYDRYQMQVEAGFYHQNMRNMLQLNRGDGSFTEIGQLAGVDQTDWSWSVLFADFDNDGYKDISITNGYLRDYTNMDFIKFDYPDLNNQAQKQGKKSADILEVIKKMPQTKLSNYIFKNQTNLSFKEISQEWGFSDSLASNGMAYADLDNDGDLDLVLNNINNEASIYENKSSNNYLEVNLRPKESNSMAIGSKVYCYAGNQKQSFEILLSRGFQSSVPPMAYFGLGDLKMVDSLVILWPNGKKSVKKDLMANQILTLNDSSSFNFTVEVKQNPIFSESKTSLGIDQSHKESNFVDYKNVPLLPHLNSREGPGMAHADVNQDGLEDLFIGGAANEPSYLYLQNKAGDFSLAEKQVWNANPKQEIMSSCFFDANGDGFVDLYLGSGSFEFQAKDPALQDQLFINDGKGGFILGELPAMLSSTSAIVPLDYDKDGDLDLFIGTRFVQEAFPKIPQNYLLENDGQGNFVDVTSSNGKSIQFVGLICDALAADLNQNGKIELLLAGEYMPISTFEYVDNAFVPIKSAVLEKNSGFWNTIKLADIDNDGDLDIIAGNKGLNDFIKAAPESPAKYYGGDLDEDGKYDIICSNYNGGTEYPCASLDELHRQFNKFQQVYNRYSKYAVVTMDDLLSQVSPEIELAATNFASGVFLNEGNSFRFLAFPRESQVAPIRDFLLEDFNSDGFLDILSVGNNYGNRTEFGRMDASRGNLLIGSGDGSFKTAKATDTGLSSNGDARKIAKIKTNKTALIVIAKNNNKIDLYQWNQP